MRVTFAFFLSQSPLTYQRPLRVALQGHLHSWVDPVRSQGLVYVYFSSFKFSWTWSFPTEAKTFLLQISPHVSGVWDSCLTSKDRDEEGIEHLGVFHVPCHHVPCHHVPHSISVAGPHFPLSFFCCWNICRGPSCCPSHSSPDSTSGRFWFSQSCPCTLREFLCVYLQLENIILNCREYMMGTDYLG